MATTEHQTKKVSHQTLPKYEEKLKQNLINKQLTNFGKLIEKNNFLNKTTVGFGVYIRIALLHSVKWLGCIIKLLFFLDCHNIINIWNILL